MIAKLYYNGWLQLPASALRILGTQTGGSVEVVVEDRGVLLRPAGAAPVQPGRPAPAEPASRKPGRPRKAAAAPGAAGLVLPPQTRRTGGRRKSAAAPSAP
jgi:hypothetical protein